MTKQNRRPLSQLDNHVLRAITGGELASTYNTRETLSSNVQKKLDDTIGSQINKIG